MDRMLSFTSLDTLTFNGRGVVSVVALDRDYDDFSALIGLDVLIDGTVRRVHGVERFAHTSPWRCGETIGLLLDEQARAAR
jgi:hypothetical protein